jgi:hypothetical protein
MKIVLSPQETIVVIKNSILRKPSLISYQQLADNCKTIYVLLKKPLVICHSNGFIMLFQMLPATGDISGDCHADLFSIR